MARTKTTKPKSAAAKKSHRKGSDGKWRIKVCHLRRIRVDLLHPQKKALGG